MHYARHRIVIGGTASSTGLSPMLDLVHTHRAGAVARLAVSLIQPACKVRLLPELSYGSGRQGLSRGSSIAFMQTLW